MASNVTETVHDVYLCPGCDRIFGVPQLEIVLDLPAQSICNRSRLGYQTRVRGQRSFPRRLLDRHKVAVRCRDAKAYLEEVAA